MQSWELVQQKRDSVLIATLLAPPLMVSIEWAYAFAALVKPPISEVMRISGVPFDVGRTQAAHQCLGSGYEWLFFLDGDVIPPPNTLIQLLSHRLPVCSALYHQKFPTWTGSNVKYMPCIFNEGKDKEGNPTRLEITDYKNGELVQAHFVPAGCLLVHRSVFEKFLAEGIKRMFNWTMNIEDMHGLSEDFWFSRKCWELGYKVMVDTGITCIHETIAKVDEKGLSSKI
jgi:hypothetical protein